MNQTTKSLFILWCLFLSTNVFCSMNILPTDFFAKIRSFFHDKKKKKDKIKKKNKESKGRFEPYSAYSKHQISLMKKGKQEISDHYVRQIYSTGLFLLYRRHYNMSKRLPLEINTKVKVTRKLKYPFSVKLLRSELFRNANIACFIKNLFFIDHRIFLDNKIFNQLPFFRKSVFCELKNSSMVTMPCNKIIEGYYFGNIQEHSLFFKQCSDRLLSRLSFDTIVNLYAAIESTKIFGEARTAFDRFYRLMEIKFSYKREKKYLFSKENFSKIKVVLDLYSPLFFSKKYSLIALYTLHYLRFHYGKSDLLVEEFFRANALTPKNILTYDDYYLFLNNIARFIVDRYESINLKMLRKELYVQLHDNVKCIDNDIKKFQSKYLCPTNIDNDGIDYIKKLEKIVKNAKPKETIIKKIISACARSKVVRAAFISVASFFFYYTFSSRFKNFFLSFSK